MGAMTIFPGAEYRPLENRQGQPKMTSHRAIILHTMVGNLSSTHSLFLRDGWKGTESHFGVGGVWGGDFHRDWDGKIIQWQDTDFQADANLEGNPSCISIETADNAPATVEAIASWTPAQIDSIVRIIVHACRTYNIPAILMADSRPTSRGIGYHRLGCLHSDGIGSHPGYLVRGGERWSTSIGKGCPGPRRIAQLKTIIIPRVQAELAGDIVEPADKIDIINGVVGKLTPIIRAQVLDVLKNEPLIENPGLNPGDAPGGFWTFRGWSRNVETQQDREGEQRAREAEAVRLALARIEALVGQIVPHTPTGDPSGV